MLSKLTEVPLWKTLTLSKLTFLKGLLPLMCAGVSYFSIKHMILAKKSTKIDQKWPQVHM